MATFPKEGQVTLVAEFIGLEGGRREMAEPQDEYRKELVGIIQSATKDDFNRLSNSVDSVNTRIDGVSAKQDSMERKQDSMDGKLNAIMRKLGL